MSASLFDPEVIRSAATSPLGVLSLMVLALAGLARAFFVRAREVARLVVFFALLLAVGTFGAAVVRESKVKEPASPQPPAAPANASTAAANTTHAPGAGTAPGAATNTIPQPIPRSRQKPPGQKADTTSEPQPAGTNSTPAVEMRTPAGPAPTAAPPPPAEPKTITVAEPTVMSGSDQVYVNACFTFVHDHGIDCDGASAAEEYCRRQYGHGSESHKVVAAPLFATTSYLGNLKNAHIPVLRRRKSEHDRYSIITDVVCRTE
jgi:hypothetical protein